MFSCFVPLLLTGLGWGTIVALEAGNFFKLASAEWRIGGFMVLANVREFAPVATGLMVAAVAAPRSPPTSGLARCATSSRRSASWASATSSSSWCPASSRWPS